MAEAEIDALVLAGRSVGIEPNLPVLTEATGAVFETGHVISVHPSLSDSEHHLGAMVADAFHVTTARAEGLGGLPRALTVRD